MTTTAVHAPHAVRLTTLSLLVRAATPGGPVQAAGHVRAGLFVGSRRAVLAEAEAPTFRTAGSTAPKSGQ